MPRVDTSSPLTDSQFDALMRPFMDVLGDATDIAVGVSGGADSLCLLYMLSRWAVAHDGPAIHAITVDHDLRAESAAEAVQVTKWVKSWPHVTPVTLKWTGRKPKTKISETARAKRYALMDAYCVDHGIGHLFLAHQLDDQAETVLMRLAAGSGLDGLAGIAPMQAREDVILLRPLLDVSHEELCATLRFYKQKWIEDPTNKNIDYLRPRLRAARDVLVAEGLTSERLGATARRIARGRAALEGLADHAWAHNVTSTAASVTILAADFDALADDTKVRMITRAIAHLSPKPARMEQIEAVVSGLTASTATVYRTTLAGCIITRGRKYVKITPEN